MRSPRHQRKRTLSAKDALGRPTLGDNMFDLAGRVASSALLSASNVDDDRGGNRGACIPGQRDIAQIVSGHVEPSGSHTRRPTTARCGRERTILLLACCTAPESPSCAEDAAGGARKGEQARVYPRRKAGESVRSTNKPIVLTREMLEPYFGHPLRQAAVHMGLCPTALKSVCRKLGIHRWPYQQSRRPTGATDAMSWSSSMSAANTVGADSAHSNSPSEAADEGDTDLQVGRGECESSLDSCSDAGLDDESALRDEALPVPASKADGSLRAPLGAREEPLDDGEASAMVTPEYALKTLAPEHDPRQHIPMYPAYMAGCHAHFFQRYMPAQAGGLQALPFSHGLYAHSPAMGAALGSWTGESPQGSREQGGGHRKAVACAVSRAPQQPSVTSEPLALSDGLEAEVELSRLAQKLEPDVWTEFAQKMLARGCPDGLDDDESSACDMSWLSPCC